MGLHPPRQCSPSATDCIMAEVRRYNRQGGPRIVSYSGPHLPRRPHYTVVMAQPTPSPGLDEKDITVHTDKPELQHDDVAMESKPTEYSENQLKSSLDTLPLLKAVITFRRVFLIAAIAGFTAATDGQPPL